MKLLLNTDAVDSSNPPQAEADPLSTPVADIDISRPVARAKNYEMDVKEAKVAENSKKTGNNLEVKLAATKEAQSTKGEVIEVGKLVLTKYYPLQATEKMTLKDVGRNLAKLARGLGLPGSVTPRDIINNPSILLGKVGLFKVAIKQETAEFPEGNEIKDIVVEG